MARSEYPTFLQVHLSDEDIKHKFRNFILNYNKNLEAFHYPYRKVFNRRPQYDNRLEISLEDLIIFDHELAEMLKANPVKCLDIFERTAIYFYQDLQPPLRGQTYRVHVTLKPLENTFSIVLSNHELSSSHVGKIIRTSGVILWIDQPEIKNIDLHKEDGTVSQMFIDFQNGTMRQLTSDHLTRINNKTVILYIERTFLDQVSAGDRVIIVGLYMVRTKQSKTFDPVSGGYKENTVDEYYIHVLGIEQMDKCSLYEPLNSDQNNPLKHLISDKNIYNTLAENIAPAIHGMDDIKKAILCSLLGGSQKRSSNGAYMRDSIHILLLGDPGTAKSQILNFVKKVASRSAYICGKGASTAGLTATVTPKGKKCNAIRAGALVYASKGHLCIDEFDKMKAQDKLALNESMEQGTVTITKAEAKIQLNAETTILAAANSTFGIWNEEVSNSENIALDPSIMSRFDLVFIIRDKHNSEEDMAIAKQVIQNHSQKKIIKKNDINLLDIELIKGYIDYCRKTCAPRIDEEAGAILQSFWLSQRQSIKNVLDQSTSRRTEGDNFSFSKRLVNLSLSERRSPKKGVEVDESKWASIRQLQTLIRLSEALAKMELKPFANESHTQEAIRLYKHSHHFFYNQDVVLNEDTYEIYASKILQVIPVGAAVSEELILQHLESLKFDKSTAEKVIRQMTKRKILQHRLQTKQCFRLK